MYKPIELRTAAGERRMDIAWLRILAVLLLFPFHTARVFDVWSDFYVKNDQLSAGLTWFIAFMEPWHMPLLFLLAGAATWFALGRRSGRAYAGERVKRLLVPFLFGLLVLIPPQSYLGLVSHSGSAPGYFSWLPQFFQLNPADLDGYFLGGHTWGHLWFIVHLLLYALVALPVLLFLRRDAGRRVIDLLARAVSVPGVILLFALALVPAMAVPEIAGGNPAFYLAVFLLGYLVMADARFQQAIDRHRLPALVLGPLALVAVATFNVYGWPALPAWTAAPLELYLGAVLPWCILVALLAYGRRFLRASNRFTSYAAEASYPVYLLHQTVIVAVAFVVVQWGVGVPLKFGIVLALSVAVSVLVYELAVRRVNVMRRLCGMKPLAAATQVATAPAAPRLGAGHAAATTASREAAASAALPAPAGAPARIVRVR
jgi:glucans biosynthesis protein C